MNKQHITITVVIAVVVAAAGFFGGMMYGKAQAAPGNRGAAGQFSMNGAGRSGATRRFGNGNDFVNGTVLSKDNNSITVQMRSIPGAASSTASGSKIVILTGSTQISKAATGTLDDISVGSTVTAAGTDNTDGSMTAQTVQIRPQGQPGPGMMNGQPTPPPAH